MHPDAFFEFLNIRTPLGWLFLAFVYAGFDYGFNVIMCRISGGYLGIKKYIKNKNLKFKIYPFADLKEIWINSKREFLLEGQKLLQKFYKDKLSWSWPITILAIPTFIYGVSRIVIDNAIISLNEIEIDVANYSYWWGGLPYAQYILWGIALLFSLYVFYRYQFLRSKHTWFSEVWGFNLLRNLLFNIPLSFMVLSTMLLWLEFSVSLFLIFSDGEISYPIFQPDLMYGLKTIYKTVLGMGFILVIMSFLPTIMLIREKSEKYNKTYLVFSYGGVFALSVMLGVLVYMFDQRLNNIQEAALALVDSRFRIDSLASPSIEAVVQLEYYSAVSKLPGHFATPLWLNWLLSARSLTFVFDSLAFVKVFSPTIYKRIVNALKRYFRVGTNE